MRKQQTYTEAIAQTDRVRLKILDVAIDSTSMQQVLIQVAENVAKKKKIVITTPNPEIVLEASHDSALKKAINSSDIAIADGIGLVFASRFIHKGKRLHLVKGRELFLELITLADSKKWKVVLLGDRKGSAKAAQKVLEKTFEHVKMYSLEGPNLTKKAVPLENEDSEVEKRAIAAINKLKPQLLFVAFGAPRQEKWLYTWKDKLSVSTMMVVGGTFDSVSGKVPMPPKSWPKSLEWLFRLITQPARIQRIVNATIIFPLTVLRQSRKLF